MKIIFFNVWNFTVKEGAETFIKENASITDVFCLQEAYEKTKWSCRDILSDYNIISDYKYINDNEDYPQVTYIRKGIEITNTKTFMKEIPNIGLALHTQIEYKGKLINICNVHGISKPGEKLDNSDRIRQSTEIINAYKDLEGLKIIGGDFNLEHNTKSIKLFEENGYIDLIGSYKIPTTRNRLVWDKWPGSKQYFSDYIFVNKEVLVTNFVVPSNEIADHLPMILDIKL